MRKTKLFASILALSLVATSVPAGKQFFRFRQSRSI